MIRIKKEDNGKNGRFTIYENDQLAGKMTFDWVEDGHISIDHTGVDEAFGGKGFAKKLFLKAVEFAREENLKITPICPYVKAQFEKSEEFNDVLFA